MEIVSLTEVPPAMQGAAASFWRQHGDADGRFQSAWDGVDRPHRRAIVGQLHALPVFRSVFEVGCSVGTNLRLIRDAFPWVSLSGIDLNAEAVAFANARLVDGSRTTVRVADVVTDAPSWASMSVDVVLTCYSLAYVTPWDILGVVERAARMARVALVMAEPQQASGMVGVMARVNSHAFVEWHHDYKAILAQALPTLKRSARVWSVKLAQPEDRLDGIVVCHFP